MAVKRSGLPLWDAGSLKRPPKGFSPEHPQIQDLKRRHFITWVDFTDKEVCESDFPDKVMGAFKKTNPLIQFLNRAMGI